MGKRVIESISKERNNLCEDLELVCSTCPLVLCIEDLTNDSSSTHFKWTGQICKAWPHEVLQKFPHFTIIDSINEWMNTTVYKKAQEISNSKSKRTKEEISRAKIIVNLLDNSRIRTLVEEEV